MYVYLLYIYTCTCMLTCANVLVYKIEMYMCRWATSYTCTCISTASLKHHCTAFTGLSGLELTMHVYCMCDYSYCAYVLINVCSTCPLAFLCLFIIASVLCAWFSIHYVHVHVAVFPPLQLTLFPEFNTLSVMYGQLSVDFISQEAPYVLTASSSSRGAGKVHTEVVVTCRCTQDMSVGHLHVYVQCQQI